MSLIAFHSELAAGAEAPPRVELIPAGPEVAGRDGRRFLFDAPSAEAILREFRERGVKIPIDWEHATQHRAPQGQDAPAAAWIEGLSVDDGVLVGTVQWTERGAGDVTGGHYKYLSPAFDYDPQTGRILRLVSAGLTNLPNLHLQALNQEQPMTRSTALVAAITGALGLAADAADDAVATSINALKADRDKVQSLNAEKVPSPERYIPRADYDAVLARATQAETTIKERDAAALKAEIDGEIDGALKAGRIAPASVDHYRALCADASGLKQFRELVKTLPVLGEDTDLGARKPPAGGASLNAEDIAVRARAYMAEQSKAGNPISVTQAVAHVTKGASA